MPESIAVAMLRDRLTLRALVPDDAERLHALFTANRAHILRWDSSTAGMFKHAHSLRVALKRLAEMDGLWLFGICKDDELIGLIHLMQAKQHGLLGYWIGYWIAEKFAGRGYTTAAAQALCSHAFARLRVPALLADTHARNAPSKKVLRNCGFALLPKRTANGNLLFQLQRPP